MNNGMDTGSCGDAGVIGAGRSEYNQTDQTLGAGVVEGASHATHRPRSRGWREERRRSGFAAKVHRWATAAEAWSGWEALTISGFGIGGFLFTLWAILSAGSVGCGGVAKTTAGCVEASIRICEPLKDVADPTGWLTYAVCLADDSLPCVIGSVAAGQSGCPNLQECLELSPCTSVDGCRAIVELCLDECR